MRTVFFRGRRARVLAASFLAAAFAVTAGFAVQGHARAAACRLALDNSRRHAFAELAGAVAGLDVDLQKSCCAASPALLSALCTQIYGKALTAQMAIGELPYGSVELEQTAALLARTGDYAAYLARAVQTGGYTQAQREALSGLSEAVSSVSTALQSVQADLSAGVVTLEDPDQIRRRLSQSGEEGGQVPAGSAFQSVEEEFPEVPALIYDGPFSDHVAGRSPRMLEGAAQVSRDEARRAAAAFLGLRPEILTPVSDGAGRIPAWGFSAAVDGGETYVEVTKAGGQVLEVISTRPSGGSTLTAEEGVEAAAAFLAEQGCTGMEPTGTMSQGGVLTVSFAFRQGEVLCYPDLIKVSVALDTGRVSGFEAEGYLMNHTQRSLPQPALSLAQAQAGVAPGLKLLRRQLALIPTGGGDEVLCWEFLCQTGQGGQLLLYVNAQTGQEERILLLLEGMGGTLTL